MPCSAASELGLHISLQKEFSVQNVLNLLSVVGDMCSFKGELVLFQTQLCQFNFASLLGGGGGGGGVNS